MKNTEIPDDEPIIEEGSPEWEEINRQADAEREKFKKTVLENPLEALKPATVVEVHEGLEIVDRDLVSKMRPQERQKRIMELAQQIIKYKTGREVAEGQEGWTPSTALFLRETLWQEGLVPRSYLPTKQEHLRARLGGFIGDIKDSIRAVPGNTKEIVKTATTLNQPSKPGKK